MPFPLLAALPSVIAGGASLIGGALANSANKKQAQAQMDFQERMSNTAYQRATADMQMAGINPMLAYSQGGASSPGGASAQMEDVVSPAVSSAMHAERLKSELKTMEQSRDVERTLSNAQFTKSLSDTNLNNANSHLAWAHEGESRARRALLGLQGTALSLEMPGLRNQANFQGGKLGRAAPYVKFFEDIIGSAGKAAMPFVVGGATRRFVAPAPGSGSSARAVQPGTFRSPYSRPPAGYYDNR